MSDQTVTFLLPVATQPRFHKRIRMVQEAGFHVRVAAFDRDYVEGPRHPYPVASLGHVVPGTYHRRVVAAPRTLWRLGRFGLSPLTYAFGTEMALYAKLTGQVERLIVEIGDIREVLTSSRTWGWALRRLDRAVVETADLTVSTSPHFLEEYYRKWMNTEMKNTLVIENKIDRVTARRFAEVSDGKRDRAAVATEKVRIGWFGVLRCRNTWEALRQWAAGGPKGREVLVRGLVTEAGPTVGEMEGAAGVRFEGPYEWPNDIPAMYRSVDVVCAACPSTRAVEGNWMWASPNRFYEAGFFRKPMLVLEGGATQADVDEYGIGRAIDFASPGHAATQLGSVTRSILCAWADAYEDVPRELFMEQDDGARLAAELKGLVDGSAPGPPT